MRIAFEHQPATRISDVIAERFRQNSNLKRFVRQVMLFDMGHPVQALTRMQRTAIVMNACLPITESKSGTGALALLNLTYTLVVFVWLLDVSRDNWITHRAMVMAMRLIGRS